MAAFLASYNITERGYMSGNWAIAGVPGSLFIGNHTYMAIGYGRILNGFGCRTNRLDGLSIITVVGSFIQRTDGCGCQMIHGVQHGSSGLPQTNISDGHHFHPAVGLYPIRGMNPGTKARMMGGMITIQVLITGDQMTEGIDRMILEQLQR